MTRPGDIAPALWPILLLAVDPALGGIRLVARAGPDRETWLDLARDLLPGSVRRVPPGVSDDRLLGGVDLAATLAAGRPVLAEGLLTTTGSGTLVLPMAERAEPGFAGKLARAWDDGATFSVIALDETAEGDDTSPPPALLDRLTFWVRLPDRLGPLAAPSVDLVSARARLAATSCPPDLCKAIVATAAHLGIPSLRAPIQTVRAARAIAALLGKVEVDDAAAELAVRLTLSPKARHLPAPEEPDAPAAPEPEPGDGQEPKAAEKDPPPQDLLLEAAQAAIPPDLLAQLAAQGTLIRGGAGAGAGQENSGAKHGRPAGARRGDPRTGARLDLVATLRTAAPWQGLRRRMLDHDPGHILVSRDDFRIRRFRQRTEKVVIFAVDASGSAALTRLAETKGAIELMLAEAYVRREQVALIAFRGEGAEVLLPPTRSLVQAKRRLAALPGGGATPLAAGIEAAAMLADQVRRRGQRAHLALMTDGRANVARDGTKGRAQAASDAKAIATAVRLTGLPTILIDTAPRPQQAAQDFAGHLGGTYLPLPRADAQRISTMVRSALDPGR